MWNSLANPAAGRCDVLAISSTGGHWIELLLLRPAFEGLAVEYVSSSPLGRDDVPDANFTAVADANLRTPLRALICLWQVLQIVARFRPSVVVSTGAGPGLFGVAVGALLGSRTVWVESLAGVTKISVSGRLARFFVSRFIVQWPDLATDSRAEYCGSLL